MGVDGRAGSGKEHARADAVLLEVDDFLWWGDLGGWWDRFESEALRPLSRGRAARYQVRDWRGDEFGRGLDGWRTVDPDRSSSKGSP